MTMNPIIYIIVPLYIFNIIYFRNKKSNAFSELFKYDYIEEKIDLLYSGKLMSHYCFISKNKIFAYLENENENGFFELSFDNDITITQNILPDKEDNINDGHPSISPDKKWIAYDTYPNKVESHHYSSLKMNLILKI